MRQTSRSAILCPTRSARKRRMRVTLATSLAVISIKRIKLAGTVCVVEAVLMRAPLRLWSTRIVSGWKINSARCSASAIITTFPCGLISGVSEQMLLAVRSTR